ncbi:MAG: hypothetical protein IH789_10515 [Acidobacteria bacterium]|nr:hypothetical protein [Acidobacteriota bacterium]MCH8948041.1 hypothetical protein [Acidobacteriota bacterium]
MADQAALGNVAEQYSAACGAGDAVALTALFTDDAVWMPPNQPAKVGKEVIEEQQWLELEALVARTAPENQMGVKFIGVSREQRELLMAYTNRTLGAHPAL